MDASVQAVLLGVISNVLTMFLVSPFEKKEKKQATFKRIIQDAIEEVADTFEWTGTQTVEEVSLFLTSPEVEAVIRQVFSVRISETKVENIELIRKEFVELFSAHFELKKSKSLTSANNLFTFLLERADIALNAAIGKGILSAHEAKSVVRYRQLSDEISVIQKNIDFLTSRHKPNIKAILEFEEKYRAQVAERHGKITPPNFDSARKLPIDDIYVAPQFSEFCKPTQDRSSEEKNNALNLSEFLSKIYRAVLLGNPGGGKSTLTDKLSFELAFRYSERPLAGRQLTPVPVILRDYGSEKKTRNCSILQFIELTANSTYQIEAPVGAFEYLLLNGRAVVIFDGLDELLETSYRQKITADVESFCNLYPSVPVLVTSREVGYEQAPLDEKKFEAYRLAPFNDEQVSEYVTKWFRADSDLTPAQQQQKTQAFLKESLIVPDLRSNPLMLALMCNIYRGENYIPQNRPDLYEKCAVMLFERWDKNRGIIVPLPFEAHIKPAMMYLAHWIYTNDELQSGVDERKLIDKTADYLLEKRYDDRDEAELAAQTFIEFCKGRAWVFTDTGAGLYQFTHRTFLEYFTAFHLVRKHSTPDALIEVLIERIAKREWDIVAQLSIQLLNKHSEGAGDEILTFLANAADKSEVSDAKGWNLIQFAARCLHFIIPSSAVRKLITKVCLDRYLKLGKFRSKPSNNVPSNRALHHREESPEGPLAALLNIASENQPTIAKSIEDLLTAAINNGSDIDASLSVEIITYLPYALHYPHHEEPSRERVSFWERVSARIYETCKTRIHELSKKNKIVGNITFWRREIDVIDFIKSHGFEGLFTEYTYLIFPMMFAPGPQLLSSILTERSYSFKGDERKNRLEHDYNQLNKLGARFLSTPTPLLEGKQHNFFSLNSFMLRMHYPDANRERELKLSADTIFGAVVIIAVGLEAAAVSNNVRFLGEIIKGIENSNSVLFNTFRWIILARFKQVDEVVIVDEMNRCGFSVEQRAFINQWIQHEVNIINKMPQSRGKKAGTKKGIVKGKARSRA